MNPAFIVARRHIRSLEAEALVAPIGNSLHSTDPDRLRHLCAGSPDGFLQDDLVKQQVVRTASANHTEFCVIQGLISILARL